MDECPVDCICEGARMLYIHPDECVDCGACEPVCPVEAIYYEDDAAPSRCGPISMRTSSSSPTPWPGQTASPGITGEQRNSVAVSDADTPMVAALPPQGH